ncbi:MAG: helix-turn-helix domain-containing protein [Sporichthyaceae bacterium]
MQELLGRMTALDPQASQALRVIACFDELSIGGVNTRGLLAAAAALSGTVAGFRSTTPARTMRINPRGEREVGEPATMTSADASHGMTVWLEREGDPLANDAMILERLALSVRIRHGSGSREIDGRRNLGRLLDPSLPIEDRRVAAAALDLRSGQQYRIAVAPLFAIWIEHPAVPEDVVATAYGPMHAMVVPASTRMLAAGPCGIGVATPIEALHHSFRTGLVALRLCDPPRTPAVNADDYAGLVDLLADAPADTHQPDVALVDAVCRHPWGCETLDAITRSTSARQAARVAGVHHSTMQTRIDAVIAEMGFDPFDGYGRVRVGIAYLSWRLSRSRVLEMAAPARTGAKSTP